MSVLVYIETADGAVKKSSLEVAAYAAELANKLGTEAVALAVGKTPGAALESVGNYGVKKVLQVDIEGATALTLTTITTQAAEKTGAGVVVLPKSTTVDSFASRVAVRLNANIVSNVTELPDLNGGFKIKQSIYTGKAFAITQLTAAKKVLVVKKNAFSPSPSAEKAVVEPFSATPGASDGAVKVKETIKATGDILLTEAEIVVSGGRGMKGPENWHLIENLAKALHAATGCSKPVSDMDWRPHHEHVGQTGVKVSPNIYIAVGISGAIQHLAGVNSSKVIVVINKDPEAPFFKAADYGIVGDAFEVLPKLTEAAQKLGL